MRANTRGYVAELGGGRWRWTQPSGAVVTLTADAKLTDDQLEGLWGVYNAWKRRGVVRGLRPGEGPPEAVRMRKETMNLLTVDRRIVYSPAPLL